MSTKTNAIALVDHRPEVEPFMLFTFSPFGLSCQQCSNNFTIQLDTRCISRHLKKHGMDSSIATARSLFNTFQKELEVVKASGTMDKYRSDMKTYSGYSCRCGQNFKSRKDSALRHCTRSGCDPSKLLKVNLIKLCCGRYVSESQIKLYFEDQPPRITTQFDYPLARAILLPFLPPKEKQDHTYTHMYYPLIANVGGKAGFIEKIKKDFVAIHSPAGKVCESMLIKIIEKC